MSRLAGVDLLAGMIHHGDAASISCGDRQRPGGNAAEIEVDSTRRDTLSPRETDDSLSGVMTPQEEREAAMAAYRAARIEFEAAQDQWDAYLATAAKIDGDSTEAGAAFERLKNANGARQDAVDSLWLAWRNRPDADGPS
jgi:hypothetical protein